MRGHWLSGARKLNRHYQSGDGGMYIFDAPEGKGIRIAKNGCLCIKNGGYYIYPAQTGTVIPGTIRRQIQKKARYKLRFDLHFALSTGLYQVGSSLGNGVEDSGRPHYPTVADFYPVGDASLVPADGSTVVTAYPWYYGLTYDASTGYNTTYVTPYANMHIPGFLFPSYDIPMLGWSGSYASYTYPTHLTDADMANPIILDFTNAVHFASLSNLWMRFYRVDSAGDDDTGDCIWGKIWLEEVV